jgi:hypothetical protein
MSRIASNTRPPGGRPLPNPIFSNIRCSGRPLHTTARFLWPLRAAANIRDAVAWRKAGRPAGGRYTLLVAGRQSWPNALVQNVAFGYAEMFEIHAESYR